MDLRKEKVELETDRYRITGDMTLPAEGFGSRLSDHVNRPQTEFFTIQDAELTPFDGGASRRVAVLMINARHIRLLAPRAAG